MNNPIKFSAEEIDSIKSLQSRYQDSLIKFGQLNLERFAIEEAIKNQSKLEQEAKEEYLKLQTDESKLIESLGTKYGDGTLSLKDGTFTPVTK